ncbi:MAG: hypothetical protein KDC38_01415, partial [Planctomycetes bacterium]|nr:hypothetical protein [Planctomycetota bacterium]
MFFSVGRPTWRGVRSRLAIVLIGFALGGVGAFAQPGALSYEGLAHDPLGAATLGLDGLGRLEVSNLGSSGLDGVEIQVGGFSSHEVVTSLDLGVLPSGASVTARCIGPDGSGAVVTRAEMTVTATGGGGALFVWGLPSVPTLQLLLGGEIVHEESATSIDVTALVSGTLRFCSGDGNGTPLYASCCIVKAAVGGAVVVADTIRFVPTEPCLGLPEECETISAMQLTSAGISSFRLDDESVSTGESRFSAVLGATLSPGVTSGGLPAVQINNLGSTGKDGVEVRPPAPSSSCEVHWEPPVPDDPAMPGSTLTIGARGVVQGNEEELGTLSIQDMGGSLLCTPDYSAIGATSHLVEVYDGGVPVISLPGLVAPVITVDGPTLPGGCGKLDQWPLLCLWAEWETSRSISIDGLPGVLGDEIRVIAENSVEVNAISAITLATAGISSLAVTSTSSTPYDLPIPTIAPSIDPLTGDVVLHWTNPVPYGDFTVVTTDDLALTAELVGVLPGGSTSVPVGPLGIDGRIIIDIRFGRYFSIYVQIDTRLHAGLPHFAVGDAELLNSADALHVRGLGSKGLDGVCVALGVFRGIEVPIETDLGSWPTGSSLTFRESTSTTVGEIRCTRELDGLRITPADGAGVPVTYTLRGALGDLPAFEMSGLTGDTTVALLLPAIQKIRYESSWGSSILRRIHFQESLVALYDDPSPDALHVIDRLEIEVEGPPVAEPVTQLDITGQGMPQFVVGKEKEKPVLTSVPTYGGGTVIHGRGVVSGTTSISGTTQLRIDNLGSSGEDGVEVDFGSLSSECSLTLGPVVAPPGTIGSTLVVGAHGAVAGSSQFLGSVAVEDLGASLSITPDYSPIGSTSQRIDVYDQGVLVATLPGLVDPVIEVQDNVFPPGCGKLNQWPLLCLWLEWSAQRVFTVGGMVLLGDEIRVIAEGSTEVTSIESLELSTIGIPELVILGATTTPYTIPPIEDLAAEVDPLSGHVILSWTNPVDYESADLIVGDTVISLGAPAPSGVDLGGGPTDFTII